MADTTLFGFLSLSLWNVWGLVASVVSLGGIVLGGAWLLGFFGGGMTSAPSSATALGMARKKWPVLTSVLLWLGSNGLIFFGCYSAFQKENIRAIDAEKKLASLENIRPVVGIIYDSVNGLIPPSKRPKYNDWALKINVTTTKRLEQASLSIYSYAYKSRSDENFILYEIPHHSVARYNWENTFGVNTIDRNESYALIEASEDGTHAKFLIDGKEPELGDLSDIKPGYYRIELIVSASNLEIGVLKIINLWWGGQMSSINVQISDDINAASSPSNAAKQDDATLH